MIPQGWKFRLCGLVRDVFVGGSVHSEMNAVRRIWWMTLRNLHWWAAKAQWLIRGWVWNPIFEEAQNEMWLSRLTAVLFCCETAFSWKELGFIWRMLMVWVHIHVNRRRAVCGCGLLASFFCWFTYRRSLVLLRDLFLRELRVDFRIWAV